MSRDITIYLKQHMLEPVVRIQILPCGTTRIRHMYGNVVHLNAATSIKDIAVYIVECVRTGYCIQKKDLFYIDTSFGIKYTNELQQCMQERLEFLVLIMRHIIPGHAVSV